MPAAMMISLVNIMVVSLTGGRAVVVVAMLLMLLLEKEEEVEERGVVDFDDSNVMLGSGRILKRDRQGGEIWQRN
jgi:hypothetical protein